MRPPDTQCDSCVQPTNAALPTDHTTRLGRLLALFLPYRLRQFL